jgi:peptidoglycan/LPS O-acetylase OafA/YrhL
LLTYLMIWVGMQPLPKVSFLQQGDYSYGLYLYAYPVQQMVAQLLPWSHEWWLNFAISTPIALGIAMLSWHLVEKPALTLKRFVVAPKPQPLAAQPA